MNVAPLVFGTRDRVPEESWLSFPKKPLNACGSTTKPGALWACPSSMLSCWPVWTFTGIVKAATALESPQKQYPCHTQKMFHSSTSGLLTLTIFSSPLQPCSLSFKDQRSNGDGSSGSEHSTVSYSYTLTGCEWVSVLADMHCRKKKNTHHLWLEE